MNTIKPGDWVVCKIAYDSLLYPKGTAPEKGAFYKVVRVEQDSNGKRWLGLEGVARGFTGWRQENFRKKTKLVGKRLIRL
jgi:hypothetical protein